MAVTQLHPMRRGDWLKNHELMRQALFQHWVNHQKYPTDKEMAQLTGLSEKTIRKHWEAFDEEELKSIIKEEASLMARQVLFGAYNGAMKGNQEDIKIILKLGAGIDLNDKKPLFDDIVEAVNVSDAENAEQTVTFEQKVLKITRRLERDKALGVVDAEVIDSKKEA